MRTSDIHKPLIRRATSTISIDEDLILRPASSKYTKQIIEAFEETWPEVIRAMPWINPDKSISDQIRDFIQETENRGRSGLLHHWVMIRPWDNYILGVVGFDRVTRSKQAYWNLGYWVRSSEQRHGIANKSINSALKWLGEVEKITIEIKVDPNNLPGRNTVFSTVQRWNGLRHIEGDSQITVAGVRTNHECYLITIGPDKNSGK